MTEEEYKLYKVIQDALAKKSTMAEIVVRAMTDGIIEANKRLNERIVLADKATLVLFEGSDMGSEQNLVETATALTNSTFNGQNKKYTIDDIRPFIKKRKKL